MVFYIAFNFILTLSQTSPGFYMSVVKVILKTLWEKEKLLIPSNFSFSHSVSNLLENFQPCLCIMILSSTNSFSLEESKICRLGKGEPYNGDSTHIYVLPKFYCARLEVCCPTTLPQK